MWGSGQLSREWSAQQGIKCGWNKHDFPFGALRHSQALLITPTAETPPMPRQAGNCTEEGN